MYTAYGLLPLSSTESIAKFLAVINPKRQIYHANFFIQKIQKFLEQQAVCKKRSFRVNPRWFRKIKAKLNWSYSEALAVHNQENPLGPLPREIKMRLVQSGWVIEYQKPCSLIGLLIPHHKELKPSILIKTGKEEIAHYFANQFDQSVDWLYKYYPPQPKITQPVQNSLSSTRNIRVPLGELLDFLDKYR